MLIYFNFSTTVYCVLPFDVYPIISLALFFFFHPKGNLGPSRTTRKCPTRNYLVEAVFKYGTSCRKSYLAQFDLHIKQSVIKITWHGWYVGQPTPNKTYTSLIRIFRLHLLQILLNWIEIYISTLFCLSESETRQPYIHYVLCCQTYEILQNMYEVLAWPQAFNKPFSAVG